MPICGNRLCVCNGATAEMRKSYASRHCRGEADYTLLKRVNCEDTSPEAIKLVLEREMQEYVTDCRYGLFPMWQKEGVTVDEKQSNYIIWLRCRYKDYEVADCTAKIKISYNQVCKAVETYWWMYASAHCLACDEDGSCKFVSFEEHANFQHVYCKVINEFTTVNTTVPLTVELKEYWDKDGTNVRFWCPELAQLPGIRLGENYPKRICDDRKLRAQFYSMIRSLRKSEWASSMVDDAKRDIVKLGRQEDSERLGLFRSRGIQFRRVEG
mmetsp:Transcript_7290/g.9445  ORF Transcript_7290/g.9445 Transcript_7290/m.9445 type:complete len:269 (+) Transcript_7290:423-1229(+)